MRDEPTFLTVLDLATQMLSRPARTGADFAEAGFDIMGGCARCEASIAAYNAYPSTSGYWRCAGCIDEDGFRTLAGFKGWMAENEAREAEASTVPEGLIDDDCGAY